jgi:hypothetical protein
MKKSGAAAGLAGTVAFPEADWWRIAPEECLMEA